MLKIGEFAKEAQVTVKTLRHYVKLGLFKPVWTDRYTGYRYYAREQMSRLNRIMVLKDLGFTLEQIGHILQNNLTLAELRGMLRLKSAELERTINEEQARLARVEARLQQIESEGDFSISPVTQHKEQRKERMKMEPKIVTKPAFTVVGLMYYGKNENNEIPQMWSQVNPRRAEINHKTGAAYGVCGELEENGRFHYLAGYGVSEAKDLPSGMERWDVPAQKYAVFPCTLQTIQKTYQYIFDTWFPQSDYRKGEGPDFEFYDESFRLETGEGMAIYMPVK